MRKPPADSRGALPPPEAPKPATPPIDLRRLVRMLDRARRAAEQQERDEAREAARGPAPPA